jgi:hypothetical protein
LKCGKLEAPGNWRFLFFQPDEVRKSEVGGRKSEVPVLSSLLQFRQHLPGDFLQRLEHARALEGHGFDHRLIFPP